MYDIYGTRKALMLANYLERKFFKNYIRINIPWLIIIILMHEPIVLFENKYSTFLPGSLVATLHSFQPHVTALRFPEVFLTFVFVVNKFDIKCP